MAVLRWGEKPEQACFISTEQHIRRLAATAAPSPCIVVVDGVRDHALAIGLAGAEATLSITTTHRDTGPDEVFLRGDVDRAGVTTSFLLGMTHSPILNELLVPLELAIRAACEFVDTGALLAAADWERGVL
jgi:hypothetical protein